jgi:hypothetical protein
MSCRIQDSEFFLFTSSLANAKCDGVVAFVGFSLINIIIAFLSTYIYSIRHQQRRMLLKIDRYDSQKAETEQWRGEFYRFLTLTAISQVVYILSVVFIINTNLWQLLIMIVATTASEYILYKYNFIKGDKYDRLTMRDDI